jgi:hypothetical protein
MAQALLNKVGGDEAIVKTPTAQFVWRINKIEYQEVNRCRVGVLYREEHHRVNRKLWQKIKPCSLSGVVVLSFGYP